MNTAVPAEAGSPTRKEPVRVRAYRTLRDEILTGVWSPFEPLREERLAERMQVSRTPVRDALARLEADGLLIKRGGTLFVYTPSHQELTDLYELRITLERRGLERAIEDPTVKHSAHVLEPELHRWYALREAPPAPDAGFVGHDEQFHVTLLRAAGNEQLAQALTVVNGRIRSVRMHDYLTDDRMRATISEHIDIAELVLAKRLPNALDALRRHVGSSQHVAMARAARALTMTHLTYDSSAHDSSAGDVSARDSLEHVS